MEYYGPEDAAQPWLLTNWESDNETDLEPVANFDTHWNRALIDDSDDRRAQLTEDNLQAFLASLKRPKKPRSGRRRKRFALPLLVGRCSGAPIEVMACPDSGSDENIISLKLATSLGLKTEQTDSNEPRQFAVANGKIVTAVGQVSTRCSFAIGAPSDITSIECVFHVFNTLAVPLIMGVDFLQKTETLSKHRDRLVEQVVPAMQSLRVNSVGRPKRSLVCRLDTYVGCATVDTGSDLDLVSPAFARARAYKIEPAFEQLEFADCSVGCTSGVIKTSLVVGNVNSVGFQPRGETIDLELFVLDKLNTDILIGQDTVNTLDVFNLHNESLIPSLPRLGESELNIIRHIGRTEQGAASLWNKIKRRFGSNPSGSSDGVISSTEAQVDIDQRENARRERERARIAKPSGRDRQQAQELTDTIIEAFLSDRRAPAHVLVPDSPDYVCPFCPGRDHKYPRPDQLQLHVRVRHIDKDKDDPLLQQALAQQPDGPNRGRRRRDRGRFTVP